MALQERVVQLTLFADGVTRGIQPKADLKSIQVVAEGSPDGTWTLEKSNDGVNWTATDVTAAAVGFHDGIAHDAFWWRFSLSGHTPASGSYHFFVFLRG